MPKYLLKILSIKIYRLAHPRLITIFPKTIIINEPAFTLKDIPVNSLGDTVSSIHALHIQDIENALAKAFDII